MDTPIGLVPLVLTMKNGTKLTVNESEELRINDSEPTPEEIIEFLKDFAKDSASSEPVQPSEEQTKAIQDLICSEKEMADKYDVPSYAYAEDPFIIVHPKGYASFTIRASRIQELNGSYSDVPARIWVQDLHKKKESAILVIEDDEHARIVKLLTGFISVVDVKPLDFIPKEIVTA